MRILISVLVFSLFFVFVNCSLPQEWKGLNGEHFIVYFIGEEKLAKEILDKAEVYYRNIATELGYPRYTEFWIWDKRVKI